MAVVADQTSLQLFDVSIPSSPQYIQDLEIECRSGTIDDNLFYSLKLGRIINVVDLSQPSVPVLLSTYDMGVIEPMDFQIAEGYRFIHGTWIDWPETPPSIPVYALAVFDLSTLSPSYPAEPIGVTDWITSSDLFVSYPYVYITDAGDGLLVYEFTPDSLPGDTNGDNLVDSSDLFFFSLYWQDVPNETSLSCNPLKDNSINEEDLLLLIGEWK